MALVDSEAESLAKGYTCCSGVEFVALIHDKLQPVGSVQDSVYTGRGTQKADFTGQSENIVAEKVRIVCGNVHPVRRLGFP